MRCSGLRVTVQQRRKAGAQAQLLTRLTCLTVLRLGARSNTKPQLKLSQRAAQSMWGASRSAMRRMSAWRSARTAGMTRTTRSSWATIRATRRGLSTSSRAASSRASCGRGCCRAQAARRVRARPITIFLRTADEHLCDDLCRHACGARRNREGPCSGEARVWAHPLYSEQDAM